MIDGDLDQIGQELDTHLWGTLRMMRAFAPILGRNGGGAIRNVLSTDAMAGFDMDKLDPADVARAALDGIEAGALEVLLDEPSRYVKAGLSGDLRALYPAAA